MYAIKNHDMPMHSKSSHMHIIYKYIYILSTFIQNMFMSTYIIHKYEFMS